MDQRQRNAAILAAIAEYTEKHASSESAAREALEREGFLMPTADAIKQMRDDGHNEQADILAEFFGSPDRDNFLCLALADVRIKTGVGEKPMLDELADAIVAKHLREVTELNRRIGYLEGLLTGWLGYAKSPDDAQLSRRIAVTENALNNA